MLSHTLPIFILWWRAHSNGLTHGTHNVPHRSKAADWIEKPSAPAGGQQPSRLGYWRVGCSIKSVAPPLSQPECRGPGTKGWKWRWLLSPLFQLTSWRNFCCPSLNFVFSGSGVLSVQGRNTFSRQHRCGSLKLEVESSFWSFWALYVA